MAAPIQSITIPRSENRTLPTPHTVYAIVVSLPVRSWTIYRRYSEFLTLHQALSSLSVGAPPAPFPPKHAAARTYRAVSRLGGLLPAGTSTKEAEAQETKERQQALEKYLRTILASTEPAWRSTKEFNDFIELPKGEWTTAGANGNRAANGAGGGGQTTKYVPGSYSAGASGGVSSGGFTRTLGAKPPPAVETDETRAQDNGGLFSSQQARMDAQDSQLGDLTAVLRRQRAMGLAINQELQEQTELIGNLNDEVDGVKTKMDGAERKIGRLGG